MTKKQKFIFSGILLTAIFFRFYLISQMPGGLFPDMAANGLDINLMQQGHLQPFYERGNGREALFFYMEWASVALFGKGVWQFSIVSALMGVLAVVMCYFVTYRLFLIGADPNNELSKNRARNIALLSMFLMAVSSWHVVLSRTAFRATLIPFFSALTFYFLLRTYQGVTAKARLWFAFACGASFALGFYTYIAYRIMVPIVGVLILWPLLFELKIHEFWKTVKSYKWLVLGFLIAFCLFIFPLAKYFYQNPGSFVGRAGQVSVFNPELYTVGGQQLHGKPPLSVVAGAAVAVFQKQLTGYFVHGDLNWRQNISDFPFLSPIVSPFFAVGLLLATLMGIAYVFTPAKRSGWWKYFLLLCWFWGMLLPVVATAEGIPHGLRGVGTIPVIFIISGWVLYEFAGWVVKIHQRLHSHWPRGLRIVNFGFKTVVVCFVLALILQTYFLYFVYAYNSPENFYYFRSDLTPVSQYLLNHCYESLHFNGQSSSNKTYLVLDKFSVQTTDYLTSDPKGNFSQPCNVPYRQVDPENSWQLPKIIPGEEVVFTQSSMFDTKKFKQFHPEAYLSLEVRNKFGQAVLAVYKVQ